MIYATLTSTIIALLANDIARKKGGLQRPASSAAATDTNAAVTADGTATITLSEGLGVVATVEGWQNTDEERDL